MNENEQIIQDGTTTDYLNQLVTDRNNLADNLTAMGVPSEHIETFTELVPKVLQIPQGSGSNIQYITNNSDQNPFIWTENEPGIYAFYDETNQQLASSVYMQYDENASVQQMIFTGLLMLINNTIDDPYVTGKQIGMVYNVSESKLIGIETAESPYNLTYSFAQGLENYVNTQFNQIIDGVKTFNSAPKSNGTPTSNNDLTNKQYVDKSIGKVASMPTAALEYENDIVQYVGATDTNYTQGYFYKCVSDGQDPATYSWENIQVQTIPEYTIPLEVFDLTDSSSSADIITALGGNDNIIKLREAFKNNKEVTAIKKNSSTTFTTTIKYMYYNMANVNEIIKLEAVYTATNSTTDYKRHFIALTDSYGTWSVSGVSVTDIATTELTGLLSNLQTTDKTNLVSAINELAINNVEDISVNLGSQVANFSNIGQNATLKTLTTSGKIYRIFNSYNNPATFVGYILTGMSQGNGSLQPSMPMQFILYTTNNYDFSFISRSATSNAQNAYNFTNISPSSMPQFGSSFNVATLGNLAKLYGNKNITQLNTTNKDSLVDAINELLTLINTIPQFDIEVVQALPTQDISTTTVYLLTNSSSETGNLYDEYIYVNNAWEKLGSQTIDLTNYYTKTETDGLLEGKVNAYDTLPTASASNEGEIAQYLGADDGTYHKGYFYQVTSDGETPATYKWSECDVQSRPDLSGYYSKSEVDALVANNEIPFGIFDLTTSATSSDIVTAFGGSTALDEIQEKLKTHKDVTFVYKDNFETITTYPGRVSYYRFSSSMRYMAFDTVYSNREDGQIHRRYIKLQYLANTWSVADVQDDVITTQDDLENATSQFAILPTADASNLGRIVQYIGPTSGEYTQGYFYQVVSDGAQTPTYSWEPINVQPAGGSSSGNVQYINQGSSQNPVILEDLDPGIYQTPYTEINIKRSSSSTATYIKSLDGRLTVLNKVDADTPDDTIILTYTNINDPDRGATGVVRKVSTFSAGTYGLSFGNFADIGFGAVTTGGNQTILGTKTFNILPKSSATPSSSDDFVTKIYVDSKSSGQTDTMPSPSSSIEGMVVQYIGTSDINYTNGYYYKCVEDTSTSPSSYKWVRIDVQPKHNRMPYTLNIIDSSNVQLENTGQVPMGTNNSYGVPVTTDTYFPGGTTVDITFYDTYVSIQQNNYDGTSVGSLVGEVINGSKTYVLPEGYYYIIQLLKMPILGTLTSTFSDAELAAMPSACSIYLTNGDSAIKEKMLEAQMRNLVTGLSNPMNAGYKIDGKDVLVQRAKINEALDTYGIGYYVLSMSLPSGSSIEKIEGKCVDTTTGNILFFPCGIVYATYDATNDYIELNYNGTVSSYNNTYVNVYYTRT